MNHSCNPNCTTTTWSVGGDKRIGIFSIKDIEPDEELTFNYQLMQAGNRKTKCLCKSENCASFIGDKIKSNNRLDPGRHSIIILFIQSPEKQIKNKE